jgi:hypothetical protein
MSRAQIRTPSYWLEGDELRFDADTDVAHLVLRTSGRGVWGAAFSPDGNFGDRCSFTARRSIRLSKLCSSEV